MAVMPPRCRGRSVSAAAGPRNQLYLSRRWSVSDGLLPFWVSRSIPAKFPLQADAKVVPFGLEQDFVDEPSDPLAGAHAAGLIPFKCVRDRGP